MLKNIRSILLLSLLGLVVTGCNKDDDNPPDNVEELITTVKLTLSNQSVSSDVITATWRDTDGPGGSAPAIQNLVLKPFSVYNVKIEVLDESVANDVEDMTAEIRQEGADHEFYYLVTGAALIVSNLSADRNGLRLGLEATFTTQVASAGSLQVILKHKPGSKAANDPVTKGETDIEVTFPVQIQ